MTALILLNVISHRTIMADHWANNFIVLKEIRGNIQRNYLQQKKLSL